MTDLYTITCTVRADALPDAVERLTAMHAADIHVEPYSPRTKSDPPLRLLPALADIGADEPLLKRDAIQLLAATLDLRTHTIENYMGNLIKRGLVLQGARNNAPAITLSPTALDLLTAGHKEPPA